MKLNKVQQQIWDIVRINKHRKYDVEEMMELTGYSAIRIMNNATRLTKKIPKFKWNGWIYHE